MVASAQGIDVSSYQQPLTAAQLAGYDFAWAKATEGLTIADPNFPANWAAAKAAGIPRGAYHEFVPGDAPGAQAAYFTGAVRRYGLGAGDMLAVVASDYPGVTSEMIREFCDSVASEAGPQCPVLVYSDLSVARSLTTCTKYPLWLAYYNATAPVSVAPWPAWTFWQWTSSPEDKDAFNGMAADLRAWIESYKEKGMHEVAPAPPGRWEKGAVMTGIGTDGCLWQTVYDPATGQWTTPVKVA